jgi:hypothetical protein
MESNSSRSDRRLVPARRRIFGPFAAVATVAAGLGGCSLIANLGEFDGATVRSDADVEASIGQEDAPVDSNHDAASSPDSASPDGSPDSTSPGSADVVTAEAEDQSAGTTNLIQNPGFELGISPWSTFTDGTNMASIAVSSMHAHSGIYSGWVSNRTRIFQGTAQDIRLAAEQGHTYTASAWAMVGIPADAGDGAAVDAATPTAESVDMTAAFTCMVDGAAVASYSRIGQATATTAGWSQIAGVFTVPTCTMTALQVYVEGPDPGVDLFVDDVSVLP